MDKVFLHICCAPCICYPINKLIENGYEVTGYWYNPNIHPKAEFTKRLYTLSYYQNLKNLKIIYDEEYNFEKWIFYTRLGWRNKNKEHRCSLCYQLRIRNAVRRAKQEGFQNFTTTLLYSKYQNHDNIIEISKRETEKEGINFIYYDFREGWNKGIETSKLLKLYRQKYCGCIFSDDE